MTAIPASAPFEIREHDTDGVHVVALRGELPAVYEGTAVALAPRAS